MTREASVTGRQKVEELQHAIFHFHGHLASVQEGIGSCFQRHANAQERIVSCF